MPRQCDMIFLPALRLATRPFPPGLFAARFLGAVIRPPRLFLAILRSPPFLTAAGPAAVVTPQYARGRSQVNREGQGQGPWNHTRALFLEETSERRAISA